MRVKFLIGASYHIKVAKLTYNVQPNVTERSPIENIQDTGVIKESSLMKYVLVSIVVRKTTR